MRVRTTMNNARKGKNGVFLAKHLDGSEGKAAKMKGLRFTWNCYGDKSKSFEEIETEYYEEHFRAALDRQNEKHRREGHKKRIKTMDEYRTNVNYCPECTLFYLGDKSQYATLDERGKRAMENTLRAVVSEFLAWRMTAFPNVRALDLAEHVEDGAPHIHERHTWIGHDEDGNEVAEQGKALAEMGIQPPDPSKKVGRYNNPKMTYTAVCREKLQEIARARGLDIIAEPREAGKQGLTQNKYITQDQREKMLQNERVLLTQQQERTQLEQATVELTRRETNVKARERALTEKEGLLSAETEKARTAQMRAAESAQAYNDSRLHLERLAESYAERDEREKEDRLRKELRRVEESRRLEESRKALDGMEKAVSQTEDKGNGDLFDELMKGG